MKRKGGKIAFTPLANATGRQYTDSGKDFNVDTSGVQVFNKKLPPLKPYNPEKCSMFVLPRYKDFNFSQVGGSTITPDKYIENCLSLRTPRNTLPVSEMRTPDTAFILKIKKGEYGSAEIKAVNGFWEAYKNGFIQKVYDKINEFFSKRSWYDEFIKNSDYYLSQDKGGFAWELIEQNIFAADVMKSPQSDIFENTKVAILRYIMYPQDFVTQGYKDAKEYNDYWAEKIRKKISKADIMDYLTLGLNRLNKAAAEAYFNEEYRDKISKPNEDIYKKTQETNKGKKTYLQVLYDNMMQLTEDKTESRKRWNRGLVDKGSAEGTGTMYGSGSELPQKAAVKNNSDRTILLIAIAILVGIFFIKRESK